MARTLWLWAKARLLLRVIGGFFAGKQTVIKDRPGFRSLLSDRRRHQGRVSAAISIVLCPTGCVELALYSCSLRAFKSTFYQIKRTSKISHLGNLALFMANDAACLHLTAIEVLGCLNKLRLLSPIRPYWCYHQESKGAAGSVTALAPFSVSSLESLDEIRKHSSAYHLHSSPPTTVLDDFNLLILLILLHAINFL